MRIKLYETELLISDKPSAGDKVHFCLDDLLDSSKSQSDYINREQAIKLIISLIFVFSIKPKDIASALGKEIAEYLADE